MNYINKLLELDIDFSSWGYAFAYANGKRAKPEVAVPGLTTDTTPFDRADVKEIYGIDPGFNDGPPWICYGKLKDGRYFFLTAWCDYTGWG